MCFGVCREKISYVVKVFEIIFGRGREVSVDGRKVNMRLVFLGD